MADYVRRLIRHHIALRAVLLLTLLVLSGCAGTNFATPPKSNVTVASPLDMAGSTLVVVLETDSLTIDDGNAVLTHVGGGDDARQVMRALIAEQFPLALMREAPFGRVVVAEAQLGAARAPAEIAESAGADFVLFVDALHQYRAKYAIHKDYAGGVRPGAPPSFTQTVRQDVDYRVWDARAGAEVARGRVESQENITFEPSRGSYVGSVEEMAEKLTQELGVRSR